MCVAQHEGAVSQLVVPKSSSRDVSFLKQVDTDRVQVGLHYPGILPQQPKLRHRARLLEYSRSFSICTTGVGRLLARSTRPAGRLVAKAGQFHQQAAGDYHALHTWFPVPLPAIC